MYSAIYGFQTTRSVAYFEAEFSGKTTYVEHIIVAPAKLTRIVANVVDANHDSTTSSRKIIRNQGELVVQVGGSRTGKLRNLRETLTTQLVADGKEGLLEGEILASVVVVSIGRVQQSCVPGNTC